MKKTHDFVVLRKHFETSYKFFEAMKERGKLNPEKLLHSLRVLGGAVSYYCDLHPEHEDPACRWYGEQVARFRQLMK